MKNELVGYVLKALDSDEHERVDGQLSKNPSLHRDLELLRESLAPLQADEGHIDPPVGLASRCCDEVKRQRANHPSPAPPSTGDSFSSKLSRSRWSFSDLTVAAGILIALGLVAVPTVNHSRFNAQLLSCQNNLRNLGQALQQYSETRPDNAFPVIAGQDLHGRAGDYATTLVSDGFVNDPAIFSCPSATPGLGSESCSSNKLVQLEESKSDSELDRILDGGGDYGYTLGYRDENGYHPTRNLHRTNFAIMADSPCRNHEFRQSSNHGSCGQNVLFEDGHVSYEESCHLTDCGDNFFRNHDDEIAAGVDQHDAVVGSPHATPRGKTRSLAP